MKEIKLIKIIRIFNQTQIKDFKLFLSSPYLNKGRNLKSVYNNIIKNYPDFNKMSKDYEKMLGKAKNPQVIRVYISHLTELALDFLGYENLKNEETLLTKEIGRTLSRLNSTELIAERIIKSKDAEMDKKTSVIDYYNLFKISGLQACILYEAHNPKNLFNAQIETITYLIAYFLLELNKRDEVISALNYNNNFDSQIISEIDKLINYDVLYRIIKQSDIKNKNFLKFFMEFYKPCHKAKKENPDIKRLTYLIDSYRKIFDSIHPLLNYVISNNLWNQWVVFQNNSTDSTLHIGYQIIENFILKIYDHNDYKNYPMHISQFLNFMYVALQYNKFEWVKEFIAKYKHLLPIEYRKDVEDYSKGLLLFHKKNFNESLKIFLNIKNPIEYIKYMLRIKILQLHYELNYFDNLPVMIESFRKFLKVSVEHYSYLHESYYRFLINLKKLIDLRSNKDVFEIEFKKNKLLKDTRTSEKDWLIEKFDELLK